MDLRFDVDEGVRVHVHSDLRSIEVSASGHEATAPDGEITEVIDLAGGGVDLVERLATQAPSAPRSSKQADWEAVKAHHEAITRSDAFAVPAARHPRLPMPAPPHPGHIRRDLESQATAQLARWAAFARWRARRAVRRSVDAAVRHRAPSHYRTYREAQERADLWWRHLESNDAETVRLRLTDALGDVAAVTSVRGATASIVVATPDAETLVGEREATHTKSGNISVRKVSKTRRNEIFHEALWARAVTTAAQALAVAPGLEGVNVALVTPGPSILAMMSLTRGQVFAVEGTPRPAAALANLADTGEVPAALVVKGRTRAVTPLTTSHTEAVGALEAALA